MRDAIVTRHHGRAPSIGRLVLSRSGPWASLAAVLGVALLTYILVPGQASAALANPMGVCVGIAAVAGVRRTSHQLQWRLMTSGVMVYVLGDILGLMSSVGETWGWATAAYVISYAAFAGCFSLFLVRLAAETR